MYYNAYFALNLVGFQKNLSELFMIVDKKIWKSLVTLTDKMGSAIKLKFVLGIHLLLKVFHFEAFVNCSVGNNSFTNKSISRQEIFL